MRRHKGKKLHVAIPSDIGDAIRDIAWERDMESFGKLVEFYLLGVKDIRERMGLD